MFVLNWPTRVRLVRESGGSRSYQPGIDLRRGRILAYQRWGCYVARVGADSSRILMGVVQAKEQGGAAVESGTMRAGPCTN